MEAFGAVDSVVFGLSPDTSVFSVFSVFSVGVEEAPLRDPEVERLSVLWKPEPLKRMGGATGTRRESWPHSGQAWLAGAEKLSRSS